MTAMEKKERSIKWFSRTAVELAILTGVVKEGLSTRVTFNLRTEEVRVKTRQASGERASRPKGSSMLDKFKEKQGGQAGWARTVGVGSREPLYQDCQQPDLSVMILTPKHNAFCSCELPFPHFASRGLLKFSAQPVSHLWKLPSSTRMKRR